MKLRKVEYAYIRFGESDYWGIMERETGRVVDRWKSKGLEHDNERMRRFAQIAEDRGVEAVFAFDIWH